MFTGPFDGKEREIGATKVAIPAFGAELTLPPETTDAKFIGLALAELLAGPETGFPIKQLPIQPPEKTGVDDTKLEQERWIIDVARTLYPKTEALSDPTNKPDEKKWQEKVAEALNHQPPKTLVLDFEDIDVIHWQDYPTENTLSINTLLTIRNILQFLEPIQKLALADPTSIKIDVRLHIDSGAAKVLAPTVQEKSFGIRTYKAQQQFIELFQLLKTKLGIQLDIQFISSEPSETDLAEVKQRIAEFWQITDALQIKLSKPLNFQEDPLRAWASFKSEARRTPRTWANTYGYEVALHWLLHDEPYKSQFEKTPGTEFFGHLTPFFKFDLLTRIALTEGLVNQTYNQLVSNPVLMKKAIDWLAEIAHAKKYRAEQTNTKTETHFTYRLAPNFEDEMAAMNNRELSELLIPAPGYLCFKPLAGMSNLTAVTIPEFVRYQHPDITDQEMLLLIRASLSKKTQAALLGSDEALAKILVKSANATLTVRNTIDPEYTQRSGKTSTAQITFPELPEISIPVKIRVAEKREPKAEN